MKEKELDASKVMITTPLSARVPTSWPATIKEVAKAFPGVSERTLRRKVRELNCCTIIGNKIYLDARDFEFLMEESRPSRSRPRGMAAPPISAGLLTVNAYERALELATKKKLKNGKLTTKIGQTEKGRRKTAGSR